MNLRLFLQDLYFKCFNEHLFTHIARMSPPRAKAIIKLNYKNRPWTQYPHFQSLDNKTLIFIHIPKCGGTSIARALEVREFRHLPASVFYGSNREKFSNSRLFTVLRDPVDRLVSILMHFRSSIFATDREKEVFNTLGLSKNNVDDYLIRILEDRSFRAKLFFNTDPGRSGFSVSQSDYITFNGTLLVKNLFTIEKLDRLQEWLSHQLGKDIQIGHHNSSKRSAKYTPSKKILAAVEKHLATDIQVFRALQEVGGCATENSSELRAIEQVVAASADRPRG